MTAESPEPRETAVVELTFRPVEHLIPYARNARTHSADQVAAIAASIVEFGFVNPVIADDKGIVAGHGRVMAVRQLYEAGRVIRLPNGIAVPEGTVPVLDCSGWTDAQRQAYVLADNQLAIKAGWDFELLRVEIEELAAKGFELEIVGFDQSFLDELFTGAQAPGEFDEKDEGIDVKHQCPKCGFQWSGPSVIGVARSGSGEG